MKISRKMIAVLSLILAILMCMSACNTATEEPEEDATPTAEATPTATPGITFGEINGNVYENESIDLTFTKPDDWRFLSEEEIARNMGISLDMFKDPELFSSSLISNVIILWVELPSRTSTINLAIVNLRGLRITEEEFAEQQKTVLQSQVQGVTYTFGEGTRVKIGENEYYKLPMVCNRSGQRIEQYTYFRIIGEHLVNINVATTGDDDAEYFEAMFS